METVQTEVQIGEVEIIQHKFALKPQYDVTCKVIT